MRITWYLKNLIHSNIEITILVCILIKGILKLGQNSFKKGRKFSTDFWSKKRDALIAFEKVGKGGTCSFWLPTSVGPKRLFQIYFYLAFSANGKNSNQKSVTGLHFRRSLTSFIKPKYNPRGVFGKSRWLFSQTTPS